jgi:hypothetical protein
MDINIQSAIKIFDFLKMVVATKKIFLNISQYHGYALSAAETQRNYN